jgi:hypothetical protein
MKKIFTTLLVMLAIAHITTAQTANYIPKLTSPTAFTNSLMYENGTGIGVGIITPNSKLTVNGTTSLLGNASIGDGFNATDPSALLLIGGTTSTASVQRGIFLNPVFNSSSTFGQGLYVRGDVASSFTLPNYNGITIHSPSLTGGGTVTNVTGIDIANLNTGTNNIAIKTANTNGYQLYASGTAQSYFGGNVGIGAASPSYSLDVQKTTTAASGYSNFASSISNNIQPTSAGASADYGGLTVYTNFGNANTNDASRFNYGISAGAMNASTGTVGNMFGIDAVAGTSSTGTVTEAVAYRAGIYNLSGSITNYYGFRSRGKVFSTGTASITNAYGIYIDNVNYATGNNFAIYSGGGKNYFGGDVGIGTNAPGFPLVVAKNQAGYTYIDVDNNNAAAPGTGAGYLLSEGGTATGAFRAERNGSGTVNIINGGNGPVNIQTGSTLAGATSKVTVLAGGDVGIGTTSPDEKLTVKGKVHAEEVKVNLSIPYPDYVFKPTYYLRPLYEVNNFITKNHHLPDVPTEATVAKDGLNLGEMNALLLKKVEELTLYLIEKDKQVNSLQSEVGQLKTAVKTINKTLIKGRHK